jgi:hypothetical protein
MKKLFVLLTVTLTVSPAAFASPFEYEREPGRDCIAHGPKHPPAYPPLCEANGITYKGHWSMDILGCYRAYCGPAPSVPEEE